MDVPKNSYHDKEVIGIYHDKKAKTLSLNIEGEHDLLFENIIQVELHYFTDQNVVFDIYKYSSNEIPKEVIEDYPFLKNFIISKKDYLYYHIDSSTGLTGIIICEL